MGKAMKWLAAASLLLAGCASPGVATNELPTGTVVLSFAAESSTTSFKAFELRVRRSDGRYATAIPFIVRGLASEKPDFATVGEKGLVSTLVLPVGDYEITELAGYSGSVWWEHETTAVQASPIHFTVSPGSVQYLGRFEAVTSRAEAGPSLSLVVADKSGDDIALAHAKYPSLGELSVAVPAVQQADSVPSSSALATP
jgi:hypothetical protein